MAMQTSMEAVLYKPADPTSSHEEELTFWTATEVAEIFFQGKLKYARILQMTRNGELPAIKSGKSYLYLRSALEKWVEKNFNKPIWAQRQSKQK
jgi:excisionase family DNA binding protein